MSDVRDGRGGDREDHGGTGDRGGTLILWRPAGPAELALVRAAGWRAWPARSPERPFFYPVRNEAYAVRIARDGNAPASGAGFVTRFALDAAFARRYPVRRAGGRATRELWVPAEDLDAFNAHLVGAIQVVHEFHADAYALLAARVAAASAGREPPEEALAMLSVAGARTWIGLDRALRRTAVPYGTGRRSRGRDGDPVLSAVVAACSPDGRVRESAVATRTADLPLPVLALRTADWAAPVRNRARRALAAALPAAAHAAGTHTGDAQVGEVLAAVAVAVEMGGWERGAFALEAVTEVLREGPDDVPAAARGHRDPGVRRLAYDLWLASGRCGADDVLPAALREPDRAARLACARWLIAEAARAGRADLLHRLASEGAATIVAESLTALADLGRPEAAVRALSHRAATVRATAQWLTSRTGDAPAAHYRESLPTAPTPTEHPARAEPSSTAPEHPTRTTPPGTAAEPPAHAEPRGGGVSPGRVAGLVAGIGECGDAGDVVLLLPFLGHPGPRVRAAAVRAVRRLGGPVAPVAALLADPAPRVVRAVAAALRGEPDAVPAARLWELLDPGAPRHVRLGAYARLRELDTWTRVRTDLHLMATEDPQLGEHARIDLLDWSGKDAVTAFAAPPPDTARHLATLLDAAAPHLTTGQARRLRWILGSR